MDQAFSLLAQIISVLLLVIMNGIFVAAEFAIVRSQTTKLKNPNLEGRFGVKSSLKLIQQLDISLSSTQLGITIASLLLGWWGEEVFHKHFLDLFQIIGEPFASLFAHGVSVAIALALITFLHVVLGELVAKSIAIRCPEATLRLVADFLLLFTKLCSPILYILNGSAGMFLRIFGMSAPPEAERMLTGAEIAMLVTHSTAGGLIDKKEEEMLHGVFEFSQTVAREVMTPRTDLITVSLDASLENVMSVVLESGLSRFPVIDGRVDHIVGLLLVRDILPYLYAVEKNSCEEPFNLKKLMREPYFIPNTKPIDDLLNEFKKRKYHMAIVLNEHGGVDGVVTLEDLLEEIVGEIFDESDTPETDIVYDKSGDVLVDGSLAVDDVNDRLGLSIPAGDYDTVAGFVLTYLGRVAEPGDKIYLASGGSAWSEEEAKRLEKDRADNSALPGVRDNLDHNVNSDDVSEARTVFIVERIDEHRVETIRIHFLTLSSSEAESPKTATAS